MVVIHTKDDDITNDVATIAELYKNQVTCTYAHMHAHAHARTCTCTYTCTYTFMVDDVTSIAV
jgi:hypothetical protein